MNAEPQVAIISMGSNLADGDRRLLEALDWLSSFLTDIHRSEIYSSEAMNGNGTYFNVVVRGKTNLTMEEFERMAKEHETAAGRVRPSKEVALDVDLVRLGNTVVRPAELCRLYFLRGYDSIAQ